MCAGRGLFLGCQLVRTLALAAILGPERFGTWSLGLILLQYAQWSHGSVLNGFRLEGAKCLGAGDLQTFELVERHTLAACVLPALMLSFGTAVAMACVEDPVARDTLLMLTVMHLPDQLHSFLLSGLSVRQKFSTLARALTWHSVVTLALTLWWAPKFGLEGAILASVVSYAGLWLALSRSLGMPSSFALESKMIWRLISIGCPIGLNGLLSTVTSTLDRTIVAGVAGVTSLGHYALTGLARASMAVIPAAIGEVLYIKASTAIGGGRKSSEVVQTVTMTDRLVVLGVTPLLGMAFILSPWVIPLVLPQYTPGIPALQVFLVGLVFLLPTNIAALLTSAGAANKVLLVYTAFAAMQLITCKLLTDYWSIYGAALASSVTTFSTFVVLNFWGLTHQRFTLRKAFKHLWDCSLPLAACGLSYLIVHQVGLLPLSARSPVSQVVGATIGFLVVAAAWMWLYFRLCGETSREWLGFHSRASLSAASGL